MSESVGHRRTASGIGGAILGVVLVLAAAWTAFAALVLLVVGLTDFSGFVTNLAALLTFLLLVVSSVALAKLAVRSLRELNRH